MQSRAIGQADIDAGVSQVDPATRLSSEPAEQMFDLGTLDASAGIEQLPRSFNPNFATAIDHDLGDRFVARILVQRAQTVDSGLDLGNDYSLAGRRNERRERCHELVDPLDS